MGYVVGAALWGLLALMALPALAEQPAANPQQLVKDWQAMTGALQAIGVAHEHASTELQRVLTKAEEDAKMRADAESRLKWVLDNWVPKTGGQ